MKHYMKIFLFLIIVIIPFSSIAGQFRITKVLDGDTVKTGGLNIEIKVRLVGIDAPETSKSKRTPGQPYSQQAKRYLTDE